MSTPREYPDNMEQQFQVGDWCFCEFKLQQVKRIEGSRILEVSDGYLSCSSYDLSDKCYPLDFSVKRISETVEWYKNRLHDLKMDLNFSAIGKELIRRWCEMCDARNDDDKIKILDIELQQFYGAIAERVYALKNEQVAGVRLFR
jgi:hypothetical protein